MSWLEVLGVVSGALAIALIARESVWGWPVSIVSSASYVFVFFQARLYADSGLQVCYVALSAYGWLAWWRGTTIGVSSTVRVCRAPVAAVSAALSVGVCGSGVLYLVLARTDAVLPWLDAPSASFSLVGQWMQARKWIQNWPLWILVDLVYVGLYMLRALYLTAGLYLIFAAIAVMGWMIWHRTLTQRTTSPASSY
jgi:nicotinamide mononucleotide transporter